jgi:hypothetical protein
MFRLALCLSFGLVTALHADEKPPKISPLLQGSAKVDGKKVRCLVVQTRYVPKEEVYYVKEGGKRVARKRMVLVPVFTATERVIPLKEVKGHVVGDPSDPSKALRPLDPTKVQQRLQKETRVLFVDAGQKLGPAHLKGLKKGTVILILLDPKKE